jgi:hypothetical protein
MKKIVVTVSALMFCVAGFAQQGPTAAGGDATGSGGSVSYSVGQIDYLSKTDGSITMNEGLQQPYEISVATGVNVTNIQLNMNVYPNPTSDQLMLTVTDDKSGLVYQLFDVQGKLISGGTITGKQTTLSISELSEATYFLKVSDDKSVVKTFKIVKN